MTSIVTMLIVCWIAQGGELVEAWRIEEPASLEKCLTMNRVMAQGGRAGVITVRCGPTTE